MIKDKIYPFGMALLLRRDVLKEDFPWSTGADFDNRIKKEFLSLKTMHDNPYLHGKVIDCHNRYLSDAFKYIEEQVLNILRQYEENPKLGRPTIAMI